MDWCRDYRDPTKTSENHNEQLPLASGDGINDNPCVQASSDTLAEANG